LANTASDVQFAAKIDAAFQGHIFARNRAIITKIAPTIIIGCQVLAPITIRATPTAPIIIPAIKSANGLVLDGLFIFLATPKIVSDLG
jgi:hypothetical protein